MVLKGKRAIVGGGGIAGLATAITLASHFEEVVVLERGRYSDEPSNRAHTPQGAHVHVLLAKGLEVLSRLVPQLPGWLDELGYPQGDLTYDVRLCFGGTWVPKVRSGIPVRSCTRPVVEHLLLRAARQQPRIRLVEQARVVGLEGHAAITGVRAVVEGSEQVMQADWCVEAGGRSSGIMSWLEQCGVQGVVEETCDAGVTYTSCWFRPPPEAQEDWMFLANAPKVPDHPLSTAVMRAQRDWLTAVVGYCRLEPPGSVEQMQAIVAESLPEPYRSQLLAAEPRSELAKFTKTGNRWRRFSRARGWPERLVVVGDAGCMLNPRFGQGMTVAALAAETLGEELQRHWDRTSTLDGLALRFQRSLEKVLSIPWAMALMEDEIWVGQMEGRAPSWRQTIAQAASQRVLDTVYADVETYVRFMRVAHLLQAPTHLVTPKTLAKVMFPGLRQGNSVVE